MGLVSYCGKRASVEKEGETSGMAAKQWNNLSEIVCRGAYFR